MKNKLIVVHIDSGLGNQMLSFCEYLAIKKANPDAHIYIETIMYDIPEAEKYVSQWNGYELGKIFGIQVPNIREYFTEAQWNRIMSYIRETKFWENEWNYPNYFLEAFRREGLDLVNTSKDFVQERRNKKKNYLQIVKHGLNDFFTINNPIGNKFRHIRFLIYYKQGKNVRPINTKLFMKAESNIFVRQKFAFKYNNHNIEAIERDIKDSFNFPELKDENNIEMRKILESCNAVAIHARRGDMLGANGYCYKFGYFRRAVKYIRKHVKDPVFVFFTNPGSIEWCKENAAIFNLDFTKDKVLFVDWNGAGNSYRDMQLMSYCKHAIITNSTFGWWGAYFITNPDKITIAPVEELDVNTTHHC